MFTLLIIIIITLIIILARQKKIQILGTSIDRWVTYKYEKYGKRKVNWVLLLTTSVNVGYNSANRLEQYRKSINHWLKYSNLDLYIIESTGYKFEEYKNNPRIFIHTFTPKIKTNRPDLFSSSQLESESILEAYKHFKEKWKKYNVIFKLTGKYFIPNFENYMKNIPLCDIYIQNRDSWKNFVATEIFGFNKKMIYKIYNKPSKIISNDILSPGGIENIERYMKKFIEKHQDLCIYKLPSMKLGWEVYRIGAQDYVNKL